MFNNFYIRRIERRRGELTFIVTVLFGNEARDVIVSKAIYDVLEELSKFDKHMANQDERHQGFSELSDEKLYERAIYKPKAVEDMVCDRLLVEMAMEAVKQLPSAQSRRFVLRHIFGLTYPEIGRAERCSARAAKDSVDQATKKIRQILE